MQAKLINISVHPLTAHKISFDRLAFVFSTYRDKVGLWDIDYEFVLIVFYITCVSLRHALFTAVMVIESDQLRIREDSRIRKNKK